MLVGETDTSWLNDEAEAPSPAINSTARCNLACVVYNYRPFAVGVAKRAATILEYNAWAFSMGQMYRQRVCSSFTVQQNEWNA